MNQPPGASGDRPITTASPCTYVLRRAFQALAGCLFVAYAFGYDTVGCSLSVNPAKFNHAGLTQLTWEADIFEYDSVPGGSSPFKDRIDFMFVGFQGKGFGTNDPYPFLSVTTAVQNNIHTFADDAVGSSSPSPGLGLYLSSLQSSLLDSQNGVRLNAPTTSYPQYGRIFENVDGLGGSSGKNIYTRQNLGTPSTSNPISVIWSVQKMETTTSPPPNLSKDLNGNWVPLSGTFVRWNFQISINGVTTNVADYYLPIEKAEYIWSYSPLTLTPEMFGSATQILQSQKSTLRISHLRASDGANWYSLDDWLIASSCIDDQAGNLDPHYGWRSDGSSLTDSVGHADDPTASARAVGTHFTLVPIYSVQDAESARTTLVPGQWAAIYGSNLASPGPPCPGDSIRTWCSKDFPAGASPGSPLPTSLDGTSVTFNGISAAVYYILPTQIAVQVPNLPSGPSSVVVNNNGAVSAAFPATITGAAPSFFIVPVSGKTYPAAVHLFQPLTYVGDPAIAGSGFQEAHPGEIIAIFVNGLTAATAGQIVSTGPNIASGVTVTAGSASLSVSYAALVAAGEFQLNVTIPSSLAAGEYPLTVSYQGQSSPPGVVIPVGP